MRKLIVMVILGVIGLQAAELAKGKVLSRNFTTFFHSFHKLPSTFLTIKQVSKIVA
jgi:hypothetical protein